VRAVERPVPFFLLLGERLLLLSAERPPHDSRENVLVLQTVDRLQERVVELAAETRAELSPRAEVERQVVDERAVQIEDRGAERS